jgi:hypothetical protein
MLLRNIQTLQGQMSIAWTFFIFTVFRIRQEDYMLSTQKTEVMFFFSFKLSDLIGASIHIGSCCRLLMLLFRVRSCAIGL